MTRTADLRRAVAPYSQGTCPFQSAAAWEADALVTEPSQTSGYRPNGPTNLEVRVRALPPLETILPSGNADVVLHFYDSAS